MDEEVVKGHKLGPFASPPFEHFKCLLVSFVPKKNSTKICLIHNLPHPFHGNSVNALVSPSEAAVQYQQFEDVIAMVWAAMGRQLNLASSTLQMHTNMS